MELPVETRGGLQLTTLKINPSKWGSEHFGKPNFHLLTGTESGKAKLSPVLTTWSTSKHACADPVDRGPRLLP